MSDMSPRAVEILKRVSLVLAEDTRTSAVLMRHFGISTPLASHHKYNEETSVRGAVQLLEQGQDIALVSDAGTPGISDPGFLLSRECRRAGIEVVTLPGPTAFVPALVDSGLPCDRFVFQGFLPQKKGRATRMAEIAGSALTSVVYESPLRLAKTLTELAAACGKDREASVSREISKVHEETRRGTLEELAAYFGECPARGEIVIIVGGKPEEKNRVHKNKYRDQNLAEADDGSNIS